MVWQLQDAKQRFSELVREALEHGPQIVTRHGVEVVVVVPAAAYHAAQQPRRDFAEFLSEGPDLEPLELGTRRQMPRSRDPIS
jgi:prevent-host-death family protein